MKQTAIVFTFVLLSFSIEGCALTQANLKVAYDETKARKGPLSSIQPLHVEIEEFVDKRPEADKIGYKRNAFGEKSANIVTTEPVSKIVREAFVAEFSKNGHLIDTSNKDVVLSGAITTFWFDVQIGFFSGEFMGTVSVDLHVVNAKTGTVLLTRSYQGHYNEKSMVGLEATWERVMNTALENMVRQASTDSELIQALKNL